MTERETPQQETQPETEPEQQAETQPAPDFEVKWKKKTPTTPRPAPEAPDVATLQRELNEERERTKNLQERWQRAAADLANLRRRTEQEREDVQKLATMLLVQDLLPVLDNFERALATIPGNLAQLTWLQGIILIERHFRAILEQQGVTPIETKGQQFNPHLHEAIAERETAEVEPGTILQQYQTGYTMHGRVIRPALVEVARAAQPAAEGHPEATSEQQAEEIAAEAANENTGP